MTHPSEFLLQNETKKYLFMALLCFLNNIITTANAIQLNVKVSPSEAEFRNNVGNLLPVIQKEKLPLHTVARCEFLF